MTTEGSPDHAGYEWEKGYITLYASSSWLHSGKPLHIRIAGEAENSNAWFMVFKAPDVWLYIHGPLMNGPCTLREMMRVKITDRNGNEVPCQLSDQQYYADHSL